MYLKLISSSIYDGEFSLLGADGFIKLADGAVYERTYNAGKSISGTLGNTNVSDSGKNNVTIIGGADIGSIEINIYNISKNSKEVYLALPYNYDVTMRCGEYNIPSDVYVNILPGATVTIDESAVLNVNGKLRIFTGLNDKTGTSGKFYPSHNILAANGFSQNAVF